jgi:hypothetical protein
LALGLCWLAQSPAVAQRAYPVAALKAAMIQKIAAFIRWPAHGRSGPSFVLAVLGDSDLGARLRFMYQDQPLGGRAVAVVDVAESAQLPECDALFIGAPFAQSAEAVLRKLARKPVLTLGDTPGLAQRGVAVNLFVDAARRVRFEVNRAAIESVGLSASFQLLSFAVLVVGTGGGKP